MITNLSIALEMSTFKNLNLLVSKIGLACYSISHQLHYLQYLHGAYIEALSSGEPKPIFSNVPMLAFVAETKLPVYNVYCTR